MSRSPWRPLSALALAMVAACSHAAPLPAGDGLLRRAAGGMRDVRTLRFSISVRGELGPNLIRRADGVLTREGEIDGSVDLEEGGALIEYRVVLVGGSLYLKGPTGEFQRVPAALARGFYDPSRLLDPTQGVAGILASATGARTLGEEPVNGVGAYRVAATIRVDALGELLRLGPRPGPVPATLWIRVGVPRLLRVEVAPAASPGAGSSSLTVNLGEFDAPVSITPPS